MESIIEPPEKYPPDSFIIKKANLMLKSAKIKYENGMHALLNLTNRESDFQDELKVAKEMLFQGLKLLSLVQNFLQENSVTKLEEKSLHNINTNLTDLVKIQDNEMKIELQEEKNKKICDQFNSPRMDTDSDGTQELKEKVIGNCDNTCDLCNKTFKVNSYLKSHKHRVHKIVKELNEVDVTSNLDQNNVDTEFDDNNESLNNSGEVQLSDSHTVQSCVKFYCSFCTFSFSVKRLLTKHIKKDHKKDKKDEVLSLKQTKSSKIGENKIRHLDQHVTAKHSKKSNICCPICNEYFRPLLLKVHILKHFIDNPFKCEFCEQMYPLKSQLNKHLEQVHNDADVKEKSSEHSLQCKVCNKSFNSLLEVKIHIPECSKINLSIDIPQKYMLTNKGKYICDQCGKEFSTKEILSQHVLIHGDFNFTCQECGKKFKKKKLYTRHLRIHKGDRPYKCDQCPRDYLDMASLKDHQVIHGTDKSFKCEVCQKEFFYAQSYKYHMRSHSGEKPYSCEFCGKSFTQNSNLKDHMKIHTGDKPFKCEICGKDFARKTDLGHHLKTHTGERPYKCDRCSMTFARTGRLSAHMRSHTGERPFKCDVCTKAFREKSGLNRHLMIHNGLRPHKCDICGQGFIQSGALNSHKKSQHPKEANQGAAVINNA